MHDTLTAALLCTTLLLATLALFPADRQGEPSRRASVQPDIFASHEGPSTSESPGNTRRRENPRERHHTEHMEVTNGSTGLPLKEVLRIEINVLVSEQAAIRRTITPKVPVI